MVSRLAEFVPPDTSSYDRAAFLVGMPIAHSGSPSLHRSIYDSVSKPKWAQLLCETHDLASFIKFLRNEPNAMGSGVTMPYKVDVIPFLDHLTPEGQAIGAINTIFFRTGPNGQREFHGTNTDCIGIREAFLTRVPKSSTATYVGRPGLVVGGGGTCRAAVYALQKFMGCSQVYIINRDKSEVDAVITECHARGIAADQLIHVETVEQARSLQAPAAIVSAVPDFPPVTPAEKAVREILTHFVNAAEPKGALLEMCYHPSPDTQISQVAAQAGWQVIGGIEAMIGQGLAQASLWTGIEITESMRAAARQDVLTRNAAKHGAKAVVTPVQVAPKVNGTAAPSFNTAVPATTA